MAVADDGVGAPVRRPRRRARGHNKRLQPVQAERRSRRRRSAVGRISVNHDDVPSQPLGVFLSIMMMSRHGPPQNSPACPAPPSAPPSPCVQPRPEHEETKIKDVCLTSQAPLDQRLGAACRPGRFGICTGQRRASRKRAILPKLWPLMPHLAPLMNRAPCLHSTTPSSGLQPSGSYPALQQNRPSRPGPRQGQGGRIGQSALT